MSNSGSNLLRYANIVFFALTVIVNSLAGSTTLIGGTNTAQVSDKYPTLVTPAGYVFAIWSVIYILLGIFVIYQALPSQKHKEYQDRISWLFILSSILNIVWIIVWQYEFLDLSVLVIFGLLLTLITIYVRLGIGKSKVNLREKLAVNLPFSVYLGWITVASIANVAATLVSVNWDGFGLSPETWATVVVAVAVLIAVLMLGTRKDYAYALVILWALVGIGVNHSGNGTVVLLTEVAAIIVTGVLIAVLAVSLLRRNRVSVRPVTT